MLFPFCLFALRIDLSSLSVFYGKYHTTVYHVFSFLFGTLGIGRTSVARLIKKEQAKQDFSDFFETQRRASIIATRLYGMPEVLLHAPHKIAQDKLSANIQKPTLSAEQVLRQNTSRRAEVITLLWGTQKQTASRGTRRTNPSTLHGISRGESASRRIDSTGILA